MIKPTAFYSMSLLSKQRTMLDIWLKEPQLLLMRPYLGFG